MTDHEARFDALIEKTRREYGDAAAESAARVAAATLHTISSRPSDNPVPDLVGFDTAGIELDPVTRAERMSDELNAYSEKFRYGPHGVCVGVAGLDDPVGQPGALCLPHSEDMNELRSILDKAMREHRRFSPDHLDVIDPRRDDQGQKTLPPFDVHDPRQDIMCGLIAGLPRRLYALRGSFDGWELARLIHTDHIETRCSIGISAECVPELEREQAGMVSSVTGEPIMRRSKLRREFFTLSNGPYLVFFPICGCCRIELFEGGHYPHDDSGYEFDEDDPRTFSKENDDGDDFDIGPCDVEA